MPNISRCPFCRKDFVDYDFELEERRGCDCSGFQDQYGCYKSNCQKLKEDGDYCWEHKGCCQYQRGYESCTSEATRNGYCGYHSKECSYYNCSKRRWIENERCPDHRCQYCNAQISSRGYCSQHVNKCQDPNGCSERFSESNKYSTLPPRGVSYM